jgi:hypothetical protein
MLSFLIFRDATAGMAAGFAPGLPGVTPGGILVPGPSMLLPYSRHVNCVQIVRYFFARL